MHDDDDFEAGRNLYVFGQDPELKDLKVLFVQMFLSTSDFFIPFNYTLQVQ